MSTLHLGDLLDLQALEQAIDNGYVRRNNHPDLPLTILNYTERCQYERAWTFVTTTCRGLIHDSDGTIVARSWSKFFNYAEHPPGTFAPDAPVTVTDKLDGSLGILFPTPDGHAIATRGSFTSEQARHATQVWNERYAHRVNDLDPGITWLFEIIYPGNRIVCDYGPMDDLALLGGVEIATGRTIPAWSLVYPGPKVEAFKHATLADALAAPPRPGAEGIVVRFDDHTMIKIKQDDYLRLHRIVTGLNARTVWEAIGAGQSISEICEPLPDEFHGWVRNVADRLWGELGRIECAARAEHEAILNQLSTPVDRKDYAALAVQSEHRAWLFMLLDGKDPAPKIWRTLKLSGEERPVEISEDTA